VGGTVYLNPPSHFLTAPPHPFPPCHPLPLSLLLPNSSSLKPGIGSARTGIGHEPLQRRRHFFRQQIARRLRHPARVYSQGTICNQDEGLVCVCACRRRRSMCLPAGHTPSSPNHPSEAHTLATKHPPHAGLAIPIRPRTHPLPPWPSRTRKKGIFFCSEPSRNLLTESCDI